ncbi:MAG: hypothetical protein AAGH99_08525 [Planctomycetota bacterium]
MPRASLLNNPVCPVIKNFAAPLTIATSLVLAGCGTPPSVMPAMRVVEQALLKEAEHLARADAARDRLMLDTARQHLRRGYLADLRQSETLDHGYVEDATAVYVAAREALLQQYFDLTRARQTRIDNLRVAAEAQSRAILILDNQDRLLELALGFQLLPPSLSDKETSK